MVLEQNFSFVILLFEKMASNLLNPKLKLKTLYLYEGLADLTHWGLNKMNDILQMTIWHALSSFLT